jgi:hypothetical protein
MLANFIRKSPLKIPRPIRWDYGVAISKSRATIARDKGDHILEP